MKLPLFRSVALTTILAVSASTMGCGYMLYPHRRGNSGGSIDGGTLVMDCLWLLVGIVPGVVFLIVDFTTGAMYVGGGRGGVGVRISDTGSMKLDINESKESRTLKVRVVDADKRVLDEATAKIGPGIKASSVELDVGRGKRGSLSIQIVDASKPDVLLQSLTVL